MIIPILAGIGALCLSNPRRKRRRRNPDSVSETYLDGIKEGRLLKKQLTKDGINIAAEIPEILENIAATSRGASAPVRELLRGERDFWLHQKKLLKSNPHRKRRRR